MKYLNQYIKESILDDEEDIQSKTTVNMYPIDDEELTETICNLAEVDDYEAINDIDVSKVTNMKGLFSNLKTVIDMSRVDVSKWDVSNVTDFSEMFLECEDFNCDLSKWNVSKGADFSSMFCDCSIFNSDLSKWDVHYANDFSYMFANCEKFDADLSGWKMENSIYAASMFRGCTKFDSDLTKWAPYIKNISDFSWMFEECKNFHGVGVDKWKIKDRAAVHKMFHRSKAAKTGIDQLFFSLNKLQ